MSANNSLSPRVNAAYLPSFTNQTVRVVGRIHSLDASGLLELQSSDHGLVRAFSQNVAMGEGAFDSSLYAVGNVVEIVGMVQADGTVQEYIGIGLGQTFGQSSPIPRIHTLLPFLSPPSLIALRRALC